MKNLLWISVIAILVILTVTSCSKKDDDFNPGNTDTTATMPESITINASFNAPSDVKITNSELIVANSSNVGKIVKQDQNSSTSIKLVITGSDVKNFYNEQVKVTISAAGKNGAEQRVVGVIELSKKLDKSVISLDNVSLNW